MSEKENNIRKKPSIIKEIPIIQKRTFTNEINIIPIKISFTPKLEQNKNLTENYNSTSRNKLHKINNNNKKHIIPKRLFMTPKIENKYSNNSSLTTSANVIIKNFNYNNVYNISIDKDKKNKEINNTIVDAKYDFKKLYKDHSYNKPKTTSNINYKSEKKNIRNELFYRIQSEKNILASRLNYNKNNLIEEIKLNKDRSISNNNNIHKIKTFYLNMDKNNIINKKILNIDIRRKYSYTSIKSNNNIININNNIVINQVDLIIILEKINLIIISLSKYQEKNIIYIQEFFNFYNKSNLKNIFSNIFNERNNLIIISAINLSLFSLTIIYNLFSENLLLNNNNIINILIRILLFCKNNFILLIKQIEKKYKINIDNIFNKYLIDKNKNSVLDINKEEEIVNLIYQNCKTMTDNLKIILDYYKTINIIFYNNIIKIFNNISIKKEQDIINYFFNNIMINNNNNNSLQVNDLKLNNRSIYILSPQRKNVFENLSIKKNSTNDNNNKSIIIKKLVKRKKNDSIPLKNKINKIEIPYIKSPPIKKYSLILDLNKTLAYKNPITNEIKLRNGLFSFLSNIKPFFELISFSPESKEFCLPIINMIEIDKKYFDYNFFKEHCIIYENHLIKDISLIGRNINKIIIIDDDENCFKLNKENGIKIKPFIDENNNDNKLFVLKNILKNIYIKNYNDVKIGLNEYKVEIMSKINI